MRASDVRPAFLPLALALAAGCDRSLPVEERLAPPPVLELVRAGAGTLELRVSGPAGLRALQVRVTYAPAELRLTAFEAAPEAARLDRVFSGRLDRAEGSLTVAVTDTRRVLLPARGGLVRLGFEPRGGADRSTVRLEDALAVTATGEPLRLPDAALEVRLK
ncbi:MAG: hypothetical protein IT371_11660 [Deltaproteobacteria bacterium]|nr:hypothetical protein [Deltaproteobacteria bacterium]